MSWIPQILVGVGFLIWMGNTTCCSSTTTTMTGGQPTGPGAGAGTGTGTGDDTDLTLALHEFLSHASANKIRNLNHFKTILKLRSPHRKKHHHAETMAAAVAGDFMEALAEMGPNGKKVYSCTACGEECSITCGTRYFRTCCFHFSKKKKSSVPRPKPKPTPEPPAEPIKSVILHLLHKTSISNPTFPDQDTGNRHGYGYGYEDKDKDGRVSPGQGVNPDSRNNNNKNSNFNNYDDIKENTADYSSNSNPRRIVFIPSRGQKRSTLSSYDENENDSLGLNVSCDIDAVCDSESSSSGWQRPGELPQEMYRDSDRI